MVAVLLWNPCRRTLDSTGAEIENSSSIHKEYTRNISRDLIFHKTDFPSLSYLINLVGRLPEIYYTLHLLTKIHVYIHICLAFLDEFCLSEYP